MAFKPYLLFLQISTLSLLIFLCIYGATHLQAQTVDELQNSIVDSTTQIDSLKKEIAALQKQLISTSQQKQTLQGAVKTLDLNIQTLTKTIQLTNARIAQKDAEIHKLSGSIVTASTNISTVKTEVGDTLLQVQALEREPLVFSFLTSGSLSALFDDSVSLQAVRNKLQDKIEQLSKLRMSLVSVKSVAESKRRELTTLQSSLSQQKLSLAIARQTQVELLAQTKNQEANYQKIIGQKKAQEDKFEQDLQNFENQLNLKVSKGSLPQTGQGSLAWPVDDVYITQYFGNTPFATANPQVYNGHGHNAVDLKALPGTPIKAARGGIVLGTGNTDLTCPAASYGKWIFIKHDNGLSTIYAHLSVINVTKGESVETGQVIAY